MKKISIKGGKKLKGEINIFGAKNAALPIIISSILTKEKLILENIPHLTDISTIINIMLSLGVEVTMESNDDRMSCEGRRISFEAKNIDNKKASYELVSKMRASILILGPLLARFGNAIVSLPGGCAIGTRPVDIHLDSLEKMGAKINIKNGYIIAKGKLKGAEIEFRKVSVGATENILMAATIAKGKTILKNAACEPEIIDLAECLIKMGAKIKNHGTKTIEIEGVKNLHSACHIIMPDRIEAGTYAIAAGITNGKIRLNNVNISLFNGFIKELNAAGIKIEQISENSVEVKRSGDYIKSVNISTNPYPKFPTDMQAQFMSLMTIANGKSIIKENIFENRFMHVLELVRMGAKIDINKNIAKISPVKKLYGANLMATDLRASVSLVLAGLIANGETRISRLYHLERGYEILIDKLNSCGADISVYYE